MEALATANNRTATSELPLLCDSPLQSRKGRLWLAAIGAVVIALAGHTWVGWLTPLSSGGVLLFAFSMALLGSMLAIFTIGFLDRRDPEPMVLRIAVMVTAVMIAPGAAAFFNERSPVPTLTVGFNEEFWKVFPLLMIVMFLPRWIVSMRDGLVYGAVGGFGFNLMETAVYVLRSSYPKDGLLEGTTAQLARLGWWGIGNHMLWAALVGAGIGFYMQCPQSRWRRFIPIAFYLCAVLTHTAQDNGVSIVLMLLAAATITALGLGMDAAAGTAAAQQQMMQFLPLLTALEELLINIFNIPLLVWAMVRSSRYERESIRTQLAGEGPEVVSPTEYQQVLVERRFRLRKIEGFPKKVGVAIRNTQNALAMQKQFLATRGRAIEGDPLVEYYRARVKALRQGSH